MWAWLMGSGCNSSDCIALELFPVLFLFLIAENTEKTKASLETFLRLIIAAHAPSWFRADLKQDNKVIWAEIPEE